jgi:hypothetical protein
MYSSISLSLETRRSRSRCQLQAQSQTGHFVCRSAGFQPTIVSQTSHWGALVIIWFYVWYKVRVTVIWVCRVMVSLFPLIVVIPELDSVWRQTLTAVSRMFGVAWLHSCNSASLLWQPNCLNQVIYTPNFAKLLAVTCKSSRLKQIWKRHVKVMSCWAKVLILQFSDKGVVVLEWGMTWCRFTRSRETWGQEVSKRAAGATEAAGYNSRVGHVFDRGDSRRLIDR